MKFTFFLMIILLGVLLFHGLIFASTPTITPTPQILWQDHFVTGHSPGAQPYGWYDNFPPYAEIAYNQTVSYANITVSTGSESGAVTHSYKSVNLDLYPYYKVVVSYIDAGTSLHVAIENQDSGTVYHLVGDVQVAGIYIYHIPTLLEESGTHNYNGSFKLWGSQAEMAVLDLVTFYDGYDITPTFTPTPTVTPTVTPTSTPDPNRKELIYDDDRRNMDYNNGREKNLYDSIRRLLYKR